MVRPIVAFSFYNLFWVSPIRTLLLSDRKCKDRGAIRLYVCGERTRHSCGRGRCRRFKFVMDSNPKKVVHIRLEDVGFVQPYLLQEEDTSSDLEFIKIYWSGIRHQWLDLFNTEWYCLRCTLQSHSVPTEEEWRSTKHVRRFISIFFLVQHLSLYPLWLSQHWAVVCGRNSQTVLSIRGFALWSMKCLR